MEDCTECLQAEINRKIRANDKLRKIVTNMPDEQKSLIYGDSLKAKMQSLDDEKVALLAAKRQFLPLQSRIEKQKKYLERISREIETNQQHRLENLQKSIEADQELDAAHAKQVHAKHEMSILVAEQTAENAKGVNQGTSGIQSLSSPSNPDPDAQQTILSVFKSVLSMQNMGCHSVAEQLMAAGATDEEVKKISQIMAQTVRKLEGGSTIPEPGIEVPKPACDVVVLDAALPSCVPGFSLASCLQSCSWARGLLFEFVQALGYVVPGSVCEEHIDDLSHFVTNKSHMQLFQGSESRNGRVEIDPFMQINASGKRQIPLEIDRQPS